VAPIAHPGLAMLAYSSIPSRELTHRHRVAYWGMTVLCHGAVALLFRASLVRMARLSQVTQFLAFASSSVRSIRATYSPWGRSAR
jgi:hypothetical protein